MASMRKNRILATVLSPTSLLSVVLYFGSVMYIYEMAVQVQLLFSGTHYDWATGEKISQ